MATQDSELPTYETLPRRQSSQADEELSEHTFQLEDNKGRPWIWLTVKSRSKGDKQIPLFFEGDMVSGGVKVDFSKSSAIKAVSLTLSACVTTVGQEETEFLRINQVLWDAKRPSSLSEELSPGSNQNLMSWRYAFHLPSEVSVPDRPKGPKSPYPIPPSFSERGSPVYVDYKLIVTVHRALFRIDHTLVTSFAYTPKWRAEPPSPLRQVAYQEGSSIIGPEGDPDGWKVLPAVSVKGTIFNSREIEATCSLAIAKPLSFAAGSPVPLFVTIESTDSQALDLLSTPSSVRISLFRERIVGKQATKAEEAIEDSAKDRGQSYNTIVEPVGSAFFWPSEEGGRVEGKHSLQGEMEIKAGSKPSFVFPGFALRYYIALLPFDAPGFVAESKDGPYLVTEKITVTTLNSPGMIPRSFAPPGYERKDETDFNNAVGYLENGNQRYVEGM
ncbi:hypothetical protein K474DRAFT_1753683 [Panus rudis PR-1116 ss-1]|nr:hypothetical protein K474DRAFT_1753683 [Panus rudis PR-1116 ss-1]